MQVRTLLSLMLLLTLADLSTAQRKVIPQEQELLYNYDYNQVIEKFEREHLPLDGAVVQYIPFRNSELYGFVDKTTGQTVIAPKFSQVFAVYPEGAIVAEKNRGYGLVGYDGKYKIQPFFDNLLREGDLFHGILSGVIDTTYPEAHQGSNLNMLFDGQGKLLLEFKAHRQGDFVLDDTIAWYRFGPDHSVYNRRGKVLKTFQYSADKHFCGIFNNVLVFAAGPPNTGPYVYNGYDVNDRLVFSVPYPEQLEMMFRLNDTLYGAMSDEGLMFVDKNGESYPFQIRSYAVGFGFRNLLPSFYSQEYITVQHDETEKFGLMNKDGSMQLPMRYSFLGTVNKGEVAYFDSTKQLIGFMTAGGKITVPPSLPYDNMDAAERAEQPLIFTEDLCLSFSRLRVNEKLRTATMTPHFDYYNRQGKVALALPDSIILASNFSDGLAAVVVKGGRLGFINKQGKLVIPFRYELALQGAYPMPEIVIPFFLNGFAYLKAFKGYIDKKGKEYFSGKRVEDHYDFSH